MNLHKIHMDPYVPWTRFCTPAKPSVWGPMISVSLAIDQANDCLMVGMILVKIIWIHVLAPLQNHVLKDPQFLWAQMGARIGRWFQGDPEKNQVGP